jgi:hypothetical protein
MARKIEGNEITIGERTISRQCEPEFVDQIKDEAIQYDAVLSMGCGAGVQVIAERLKNIPVLPAMNTIFIGASDGEGNFLEMCAACGDCILSLTGGICPVARCAKQLLNGPCGGAQDGKCEISPDIPCAWNLIIERLSKSGNLHKLERIFPLKNWGKSRTYSLLTKGDKRV